jgi:antitoxin (DNA-binding transcriptional repressor) of toxin-antitoxin stability system
MLSASPGAACAAPGPHQAGSPSVLTAAAAAAARLLQLQQKPTNNRSSPGAGWQNQQSRPKQQGGVRLEQRNASSGLKALLAQDTSPAANAMFC